MAAGLRELLAGSEIVQSHVADDPRVDVTVTPHDLGSYDLGGAS